jgi:DNA-binding transcriptional LysR family regulator
MSIRALRFSLTLAEELHFGRAAQRHYIAAQPFGRIIRDLEASVGFQIIARTSRRVEITPRGNGFLAEAQRLVEAFDALTSRMPAPRSDDHLSFAVLGFGICELWGDLREALFAAQPGLEVCFSDVTFAEQYEVVRNAQADVGFVMAVQPIDGIDLLPVMEAERVAVVPRRSPLADAHRLSVGDVAGEPFVDVELGTSGIERWLGDAWMDRRSGDRVRYPAALPAAVALTNRITMHSAAAADYFPHPQVAFVPLEGRECRIAIAVRSEDHRPAIEAIRHVAPMLNRAASRFQNMGSGTKEIDSGRTLQETASR